jgi:ABC-type Mn2+/Zn2+ transport system permease subunit
MLVAAVSVAVVATIVGTLLAKVLDRPTGPLIITVATVIVVLSLARPPS